MKNMPRSLYSEYIKKLQPQNKCFALGESSAGGPSHCFLYSLRRIVERFFVEALRNIVRSFRVKGQKWSGRSLRKT